MAVGGGMFTNIFSKNEHQERSVSALKKMAANLRECIPRLRGSSILHPGIQIISRTQVHCALPIYFRKKNFMAATKYLVKYYIDWNDGTASEGILRFRIKNLRKIFDQLYEKIVIGSITDEEMYEPGMINEISITIIKNHPEKTISKST